MYDGTLTPQSYLEIHRWNIYYMIYRWQKIFEYGTNKTHNARAVITYPNRSFDSKVIATNTPLQWTAKSADLTPHNFYLWGTAKNKVFGSNLNYHNIGELREAVVEASGVASLVVGVPQIFIKGPLVEFLKSKKNCCSIEQNKSTFIIIIDLYFS